jgi:hypothetical protein
MAAVMSAPAFRSMTGVSPNAIQAMAAVSARHSLAEVLTELIEQWAPANQVRFSAWTGDVLKVDAHNRPLDEHQGAPPANVYRDPGRRSILLATDASLGSLHWLTYDEQRPGDQQAASFGNRHCVALRLGNPDLAEQPLARVLECQRAVHSLALFLARRFDLLGFLAWRDGTAYAPSPPLAQVASFVRLVSGREVEAAYVDSDAYWAAWPEQQAIDAERRLLARALDVADELAFKQATYPQQWALARAAKPGLTRYGSLAPPALGKPYLHPYERSWLESGQGVIAATHYRVGDALVDVSAWSQPGTHIAAREVAQLLRWLSQGRLDSGETVKEIRVTFPDRAQAEPQKRVLIDIGCRVFCYGATPRELVELTDVS